MKINQAEKELKDQLMEQLRFIKKSSNEFDNGDISEAKRIATHVRILLHDTSRSKSLLLTMGDKGRIIFLNSARPFNPENFMPYMGLVSISIDSNGFRGEYKPLLENHRLSGDKEDWRLFDD